MNKNDTGILYVKMLVLRDFLANYTKGLSDYAAETIELFEESLKKVKNESTHPGEFICSECGAKTKLATVTRDGEHPSEPSYCPNCGREVAHG